LLAVLILFYLVSVLLKFALHNTECNLLLFAGCVVGCCS